MPQLAGILEFMDDSGSTLVKRLPDDGAYEIPWGTQLVVRESQKAIFFRDGRSLDIFGPGRHVLQTQNMPVLTKMVTSLAYGDKSPFRAEVYFLNMKLFPNLKWGTKEPILFRDNELQMIRLRSYGIFSIQIRDPTLFLNKVVGTQGLFRDADIEDYLRNIIVTRMTDVLGNTLKSVFDIPREINKLSLIIKSNLEQDFSGLGLTLHDFYVNAVSPPPAVQEMIDQRTSREATGNLDKFVKYKTGLAIEKAAENPGGMAPAMFGVIAGTTAGGVMAPIVQESATMQQGSDGKSAFTPIEKIRQLKELLDMGAISREEFEMKKKELLGEI